jgi:hexokinase
MTAQQKANAFLTTHELGAQFIDAEEILDAFQSEMAAGLAGDPSSLKMIPSFVSVDRAVPHDTPVVVLDAGGTNLRVARVTFGSDGTVDIDGPQEGGKLKTHDMPGAKETITKEAFFKAVAGLLAPVAGALPHIGFCFSYPAEITPDCDGKLIHWTKEIKVPELEGQFVGGGLLESLGDSAGARTITVLNDTIATLLAGKSQGGAGSYSSYVGFILGTGTNTAYIEQNANITKRDDLAAGGLQAINVESGNFAKCVQTDIDKAFDHSTANPGQHMFEKMISGGYLGGLTLEVLRAASREGVFSSGLAERIASMSELSTKAIDDFAKNPCGCGPFDVERLDVDDCEAVLRLYVAVVKRAALLTAANISAAVVKSGCGSDAGSPVCVNVDGSTFYKTYRFPELVHRHLRELLGRKRGLHYEVVQVNDAPIVGAAVAGLTR